MKTKQEAARFLGISVRTLERYTKAKRLPFQYDKGKTRAIVVYHDDALNTFKKELDTQQAQREVQVTSTDAMQRIGFRLDPYYLKRLEQDGARQKMSAGEYARRLVVGSLEDFKRQEVLAAVTSLKDEVDDIRDAVAPIPGEVQQLRRDIIQTLKVLVLSLTDATDKDVNDWIAKGMGPS